MKSNFWQIEQSQRLDNLIAQKRDEYAAAKEQLRRVSLNGNNALTSCYQTPGGLFFLRMPFKASKGDKRDFLMALRGALALIENGCVEFEESEEQYLQVA